MAGGARPAPGPPLDPYSQPIVSAGNVSLQIFSIWHNDHWDPPGLLKEPLGILGASEDPQPQVLPPGPQDVTWNLRAPQERHGTEDWAELDWVERIDRQDIPPWQATSPASTASLAISFPCRCPQEGCLKGLPARPRVAWHRSQLVPAAAWRSASATRVN